MHFERSIFFGYSDLAYVYLVLSREGFELPLLLSHFGISIFLYQPIHIA